MKVTFLLLLSIFLSAITFSAAAHINGDVVVKVDAQSGNYIITCVALHWTFAGSVGQPLANVQKADGIDNVGEYESLTFSWKSNVAYVGNIRWYKKSPVVIFSLMLPNGTHGQSPVAFPSFTSYPDLPFHFSYHNHIFALPEFYLEETSTPWLFYNNQADACVISPASDFMVSLMTNNDSTTITSGLNPEVKNLPANFTHSTIMITGKG